MFYHLRFLSFTSLSVLGFMSANAQAADIWSSQAGVPAQTGWSAPQQHNDDNWQFELGAGAMFAPKYEGSDNYTVTPIPHISAEYKEGLFFANPFDGIGSYPLRGENYKVGAAIGVDFGRQDDDDKDNLRGMGDIDMSATANLLGEYDIGPLKLSGKLTKGNDDYGMTAEADIGTMFPVSEKMMLMGKIGTKWADEDYMNTYFGVSDRQSARSGYSAYSADSGFKSVGVSVGAFYSITENWNAMLMVNGDQLLGDAADSPITKNDFNPSTLLSVSYKF